MGTVGVLGSPGSPSLSPTMGQVASACCPFLRGWTALSLGAVDPLMAGMAGRSPGEDHGR